MNAFFGWTPTLSWNSRRANEISTLLYFVVRQPANTYWRRRLLGLVISILTDLRIGLLVRLLKREKVGA